MSRVGTFSGPQLESGVQSISMLDPSARLARNPNSDQAVSEFLGNNAGVAPVGRHLLSGSCA